MAPINKRIFNTDDALKGTLSGICGKWQTITYSIFVFGYAVIVGWISHLLDYNLLQPKNVTCDYNATLSEHTGYIQSSIIQRMSGKKKYYILKGNDSEPLQFEYSTEFGRTIATDLEILCDISDYIKLPRYSHFLGFIIGCVLLGFASDKGGRKMIILACIWTTGIMSIFQLVGHDFVSLVFFQFFIGLFSGGVQASFLPAILEMFPKNFRAFYGVFFHLIVCLFELLMPWLAKSFKEWQLLQIFVTAPLAITAVLYYFVYESIFWYLAYKEYDKAIQVLMKLAKRNHISFETKFTQAKDFLHAKHSKATQVEILPLLRLQDVESLGKKYPQIDMTELQKQKANSSKFRRFLNSLKGESYRSTNTIYRPFDFIYSPTLLVYVLILCGLWFTNGLTDSMDIIPIKESSSESFDFYLQKTISNLGCFFSSTLAIVLAIFKCGRRWLIFAAYLVIEVCLLGSLIAAEYKSKENDEQTRVALVVLYHFCKFSTHFGFVFLMLITAELFPTSLRCTGFGICFMFKAVGSLIASPDYLNYNSTMHRLGYCLLTLFFGSMTLFLPETKEYPLPRCILQIEAMPSAIGKKLRSRKVQLACERKQTQYAETLNAELRQSDNNFMNLPDTYQMNNLNTSRTNDPQSQSLLNNNNNNNNNNSQPNPSGNSNGKSSHANNNNNSNANNKKYPGTYDTVTSVHDIEQDDHIYYRDMIKESQANHQHQSQQQQPSQHVHAQQLHNILQQTSFNYDRTEKLGKIQELPSKNITRNNSTSDLHDQQQSNIKV